MKHSAFTLIELLVVTAVILLLAGILLPAINGARESARRAQCIARQRDIVTAMTAYHTENNGLPGYVETSGRLLDNSTYYRHLAWFMTLYPHIGEVKRYEVLTREIPNSGGNWDFTGIASALVPVGLGICPSANTDTPLNYVVNCGPHALSGKAGELLTGAVTPHFTLFKDRRQMSASDLRIVNAKVKLDEIPDGTASTIILSENVETVDWRGQDMPRTQIPNSVGAGADAKVWFNITALNTVPDKLDNTRSSVLVSGLGFIWSNKAVTLPLPTTYIPLPPNTTYTSSYQPAEVSLPVTALPPPTARPSSHHRSTFIAAFAESSVKPLNVGINADVYLQYVCPDDKQARKQVADGGLGYGN
ncbi:MAG: DUF1559 domain-containing protein [Planctomycetaceae bacterium]|jgi:prepilin-type N-terminal cleavage/methylation domain-containing protein|nr:DUF1559 domain-containing protein [Planctomycetaceae bacterium]